MPYRSPLVAYEVNVADPVDLPIRAPGDPGPSGVTHAEVLATEPQGVTLKAVTGDGQTLAAQITAVADGVIRVRLAQDLGTQSRSARAITLVKEPTYTDGTVSLDRNQVLVTAGDLVAELTLAPWQLRFRERAGRFLVEQNTGERDISGRMRVLPFGRSLVNGAVVAYHETFTARPDEHFFGFGEKFTGFDKRGQRIVSWNYDAFGTESERAYKNVPFYISSRGYGVLVASGMATEFDLCHDTHSCVQIVVPDDLLDYYLIAGPTPAQVLDRYNLLTSRPTLPPAWAFGTWISGGFFADSQERVLERARTIRAKGIPCDVLHLDCYWQTPGHWSDLRWDPKAFPDPTAMLAELKELGFQTCLWINPYISHRSPVFQEAAERGFLLRHADGRVYIADTWHGSHAPGGIVDFTSPEATAWFQDQLRRLLEQGVAVFKSDFAEGVPVDAHASNGMTGEELHNVYALLYNDAVAEVTRQVTGYSLVWARSSFTGGQRHAAQWGGDATASYPAMASTLRGGLSYALSGVPFWSHDIGGFTGTPSDDLYVRWAQFGALSPLVRFHGTTSRLPWEFGPEAERAAVEALRLRYRLIPYLYSTAVDSSRTGAPMMRPVVFDSFTDPVAWSVDLQYRLGPDLLVAPVFGPETSRSVYLPQGRWVDYWSGEVYTGERYVTVSAPLEQVPLFVRDGALLPTTDITDRVGDDPYRAVTVTCWNLSDGETSTILRGASSSSDTTVTLRRDGDRATLVVSGPVPVRAVAFARVAGVTPPSVVVIDGTEVPVRDVDGVPTATLS